jgi:hypothetical protein
VLERGGRTRWTVLAPCGTRRRGNALLGASSDPDLWVGRRPAVRIGSSLACRPFYGPIGHGRAAASGADLLHAVTSLLSHGYDSLQNALRRLYLSWTLLSNPHLPLSSRPVPVRVPRGPPSRRRDEVRVEPFGQGPMRARPFRREGDTIV